MRSGDEPLASSESRAQSRRSAELGGAANSARRHASCSRFARRGQEARRLAPSLTSAFGDERHVSPSTKSNDPA